MSKKKKEARARNVMKKLMGVQCGTCKEYCMNLGELLVHVNNAHNKRKDEWYSNGY